MICELQWKWSITIIKRLNLQTQILGKMQIKLETALRQIKVMLKQHHNFFEICFALFVSFFHAKADNVLKF